MYISDFGYQRLIERIGNINELCRQTMNRTTNPAVLREIREIGDAVQYVETIVNEEIYPDGPSAA